MSTRFQCKDSAGRDWRRYTCEFTSPDGVYVFDLWAVSDFHAQLQLDALKESAKVMGCVVGTMPGDGMLGSDR